MTREQEQSSMDESSVGGAKKGNKNLTWTPAMDNCLIDIMLEMVKNNQYQNGTFRPGTYKEMERQLNLLEPKCGVRVDPNIQSRLKTLKKKFNGVKELRSLSGAGWNDALKQVEIDPVIYNEYIKVLFISFPIAYNCRYCCCHTKPVTTTLVCGGRFIIVVIVVVV
ncbi:hypothetical protein LINGRAPRIM_LOCUS3404 [Linum grandiflorum]